MTVYHAKTDPDLLTRLRQMLGSSARHHGHSPGGGDADD